MTDGLKAGCHNILEIHRIQCDSLLNQFFKLPVGIRSLYEKIVSAIMRVVKDAVFGCIFVIFGLCRTEHLKIVFVDLLYPAYRVVIQFQIFQIMLHILQTRCGKHVRFQVRNKVGQYCIKIIITGRPP